MESSVGRVFSTARSSLFTPNAKPPKIDSCLLLPPLHGRGRLRMMDRQRSWEVKCTGTTGSGASVSWPEKQRQTPFGDEIVAEEQVLRLGSLGDKCKEVRGIAEMLECLESEAIMGEDEGREPADYNRRAQIFDKSSRVFQALKQNTNSTTTPVD